MTVTPMMAQYLELKKDYSNALLFYRMGDFYEMFFDDAIAASQALDIALTKRGKHEGADIPMCGVPVHAAEGYLLTLIRKGFRVAVCEQMESPTEAKRRGSKSVVKREVVRLVTPGTLTEDALLEARRHNYLAAYAEVRDKAGLAWVDISTGNLRVVSVSEVRLGPELARLAPSELIVSEAIEQKVSNLASEFGISLSPLGKAAFDSSAAEARIQRQFRVGSSDAFGSFDRAEVAAIGAIIQYLEITQKGRLPLLRTPQKETQAETVQIDASTRRNLELTQSLSGGRSGSLISVLDKTVTPGGARLLEQRISSPSKILEIVQSRLVAVECVAKDPALRSTLRAKLRRVPDLDRALSRLSLERGGPRDMAAIRNGLLEAQSLAADVAKVELPPILHSAIGYLSGHKALIAKLESAIVADPPLLARDGGYIATGWSEDLDEARKLRDEGRGIVAKLQQSFVIETGISSLKIKHNNVLGYFVETTAIHSERMLSPPLSERFIHRQTTANQVRFTTLELAELETKILNAGARALEIEKVAFESMRQDLLSAADSITQTSFGLSEFDVATSMAELAVSENWVKPKVDGTRAFQIDDGRHPVVERALRNSSGWPFVANSCDLSASGESANIWLLTGPNMSGKSTFLRQNALIALLAQSGSYVPASFAHIGMVSQIFSRVGASDDLARGRSTFMVEMVETAAILNQADDRALVILDEIGRGTATYDGLSIAWATLEHLHDINGCRALFATHYHEMTGLASKLSGIENATVAVKEWEGEVVFLHEVHKGAADRSYGVQVAQLAGLPESVILRARAVLEVLEKGEREGGAGKKGLIDDLPLFSARIAQQATPKKKSHIEIILAEIHPDEMTPLEALSALYRLKGAIKA